MSIQDLWTKFKSHASSTEYLLAFIVIAVSIASFGLGRLSVDTTVQGRVDMPAQAVTGRPTNLEKQTSDISVDTDALVRARDAKVQVAEGEGGYVASKSGTKYHLPWCSGAKRIKEANKVWFKTKEEAEASGYTPAANCKGI